MRYTVLSVAVLFFANCEQPLRVTAARDGSVNLAACSDRSCLKAVATSAGDVHSCALLEDGEVLCWGDNESGQLGNDSFANSSVPVAVANLNSAVQLSAGSLHACAVRSDHSVVCWGDNQFGQLGNGTTENSSVPVSVIGLSQAKEVSCGGDHSCAILADGEVFCWGSNILNRLGTGTNGNDPVPAKVAALDNATVVSLAIGGEHSCAVIVDGSVVCWGDNEFGEVGDINAANCLECSKPVKVDLPSAVRIAVGSRHSCAALSDGTVRCWGYGNSDI